MTANGSICVSQKQFLKQAPTWTTAQGRRASQGWRNSSPLPPPPTPSSFSTPTTAPRRRDGRVMATTCHPAGPWGWGDRLCARWLWHADAGKVLDDMLESAGSNDDGWHLRLLGAMAVRGRLLLRSLRLQTRGRQEVSMRPAHLPSRAQVGVSLQQPVHRLDGRSRRLLLLDGLILLQRRQAADAPAGPGSVPQALPWRPAADVPKSRRSPL